MKKSLFFLLILFNSSFLFAQKNDSIPKHRNEWGLNITGLVSQFFSFNGNVINPGAFLITYKNIKGKMAFRSGFGLLLSQTESEGGNNSAPLKTGGVDTSVRLGFEKQFPLERRWLFTAGLDFLLGFKDFTTNSESNFGTIKIKDNEWSAGLGPVLGVHFRFNQRVSIGTEGTIYLRYFNSKTSTDFGGVGGGDVSEKTKGFNFVIDPPFALYFAVRL